MSQSNLLMPNLRERKKGTYERKDGWTEGQPEYIIHPALAVASAAAQKHCPLTTCQWSWLRSEQKTVQVCSYFPIKSKIVLLIFLLTF